MSRIPGAFQSRRRSRQQHVRSWSICETSRSHSLRSLYRARLPEQPFLQRAVWFQSSLDSGPILPPARVAYMCVCVILSWSMPCSVGVRAGARVLVCGLTREFKFASTLDHFVLAQNPHYIHTLGTLLQDRVDPRLSNLWGMSSFPL